MTEFPLDLEAIAKKYEPAIEIIRQERSRLGLDTPDNIKISAILFTNFAGASAHSDQESNTILVNPLNTPSCMQDEVWNDLYKVGDLFDILRPVFGGPRAFHGNKLIIDLLTGHKDFSELRRYYGDDRSFEYARTQFEKRRGQALRYLKQYAGLISQPPDDSRQVSVIGHEIDHLDFNSKNTEITARLDILANRLDEKDIPLDKRIALLGEYCHPLFTLRSEMEVKGYYFQLLRDVKYDPDKLDSVRQKVTDKVDNYVYNDFIAPFISYLSWSEGYKAGIYEIKRLHKLQMFVKALFDINEMVPDQRRAVLETMNDYNPELIGKIVIGVTEKLNEYRQRCRETIDKVHKEYEQRLCALDLIS